ncbi:major facilitator superfamily MFS-1 [Hymenopellis radicata]|nr:major facilitator superfamily MFS-1 [Hymenopellis radicata]
MSSTRISRSFGPNDSALDDENETPQATRSSFSRVLGRFSFSGNRASSKDPNADVGDDAPLPSDKAPVPTVLQAPAEVYQTPLPVLSMIVLSITMLGEFLSANVSTPFLLFMVKGFGKFEDEAEIAFWTGVLVSTFFLTQFLTSLLWATVADRHGRRAVLVISLLGSAITCAIFGTCTTLEQAICVRLLQGIFAGAVGVARGSVAFVTDPTNEGRAYAILGFCWGFGGVAGAIIGGTFETPAAKFPAFKAIPLFVNYPYLLPCLLAAAITFAGAVLGCFLGPDGGPREGAIHLAPEKDLDIHPTIPEEESIPPSPIFDEELPRGSISGSLGKRLSAKLSGYFASHAHDGQNQSASPALPLNIPTRLDRTRTFSSSRPSRTAGISGSAYGYGASYRNRLASGAATIRTRRGSMASSMRRRRGSNMDPNNRESMANEDMNFAQRLLMANGDAVTNIADLWVAAAMNVDNEDPFEETDDEMESDEEDGEVDDDGLAPEDAASITSTPTRRGRRTSKTTTSPVARLSFSQQAPPSTLSSRHHLQLGSPRRPSSARPIPIHRTSSMTAQPMDGTPTSRRFSSNMPAILANPGVRTPPAVTDAQQLLLRTDTLDSVGPQGDLAPIMESRRVSHVDPNVDLEASMEKPPSLMSQLPLAIIFQYGLLALHSTTHDQVFMSYLVTDYDSGGLNLNAGHFAQLIALMCLCQIAYQFYLYPNIGPPRGRFSHLAMFRLGSFLFIPSYVTVILYRVPFASEEDDGNFVLMAALAISTACRFCGNTFAYTAVSILLNYMTPPNAVGIANGIAQSMVSLARFIGPVFGGWLWSVSIEGNPNGYPLGFFVCAGVCGIAILHSFLIR